MFSLARELAGHRAGACGDLCVSCRSLGASRIVALVIVWIFVVVVRHPCLCSTCSSPLIANSSLSSFVLFLLETRFRWCVLAFALLSSLCPSSSSLLFLPAAPPPLCMFPRSFGRLPSACLRVRQGADPLVARPCRQAGAAHEMSPGAPPQAKDDLTVGSLDQSNEHSSVTEDLHVCTCASPGGRRCQWSFDVEVECFHR